MGGAAPAVKALFVTHSAVPAGAELALLDIAKHFRARARVVLLADGPLRVALDAAGVGVDVLPMPEAMAGVARGSGLPRALRAGPGMLRLTRRLARMAQAADVTVACSQKAFVASALARPLSGRPLIWYLRDILDEHHFSAAMRRLAVALANRMAARVFVNSEATGDAFRAAGGRSDLVRVVLNGIDPSPFLAIDDAAITRAQADLAHGSGFVAGMFGRLSPWKGQDVFIDAIERLQETRGVIVGGPLFGEEAYARRLREMVAARGLRDRVHLLGHRSDIPALMAACDVVVHASVAAEPFGRVVVEGMLSRRPVVATAAGGVGEIVDHGRNGLLVPPGDPAALGEALARLSRDSPYRERLADAGFATASERFSLGRMLDTLDAELAQVVGERRTTSRR